MACRFSSGLVMSILIILLAVEYSSANCDQGNLGAEAEKDVFLQSATKFLLGRKMLQGMDGKLAYSPGETKPADIDNPLPEAQKLKHSQESLSDKNHSTSKKKEEATAFLEAADEVANLMRRDYRGMARRKPPINNHEPKD